jgi:adenylate cyclase
MADKNELISGVNDFFNGNYNVSSGYVIPDVEDIEFGKTGRELELAMMFIDIRESTKIVDGFRRVTAAKMYKSFLWGISQIARNNKGELRSFNGDGVLIAFIGDSKCTNAARAGLQMSWFCSKVLKPKLQAYFQDNAELNNIDFDYGIGIDKGKVLVVRGGIRGDNNNDLVWVGHATNYAVKLSSFTEEGHHIFISEDVYKNMNNSSKYDEDTNLNMWEARIWGQKTLYCSSWIWTPPT